MADRVVALLMYTKSQRLFGTLMQKRRFDRAIWSQSHANRRKATFHDIASQKRVVSRDAFNIVDAREYRAVIQFQQIPNKAVPLTMAKHLGKNRSDSRLRFPVVNALACLTTVAIGYALWHDEFDWVHFVFSAPVVTVYGIAALILAMSRHTKPVAIAAVAWCVFSVAVASRLLGSEAFYSDFFFEGLMVINVLLVVAGAPVLLATHSIYVYVSKRRQRRRRDAKSVSN